MKKKTHGDYQELKYKVTLKDKYVKKIIYIFFVLYIVIVFQNIANV